MSEKTVFISYRRDATGKAFARSLKQELTHRGYDVFLDVDCIDAGQWAEQILTQVPKRAHFLLLLTQGALDRCADENDWVRREFLLALERGRNIVPVREESVDLAAMEKSADKSVHAIFGLQIADVRHGSFESDVETLTTRYIPPHKAPKETASNSTPFHADISRIDRYAPEELIGREGETRLLSGAWDQAVRGEPKRPHVVTFVALGGEGKTSLVAKWAAELAHQGWPGCDAVFAWSFYSQGTREQTAASSDVFLKEALSFFGDPELAESSAGAFEKGRRLAHLTGERRALLILDGLEPLQYAPAAVNHTFERRDIGVIERTGVREYIQ
ncbi:MAG: toll/interleukin-1 receptor domain-containing protein [Acidobacteria bacterium]|nr:toll/interleukin-1 receptor domain-containing protein [Acidobacteriota bacterium]